MAQVIAWFEKLTKGLGKLFGWLIIPLLLALCYEVFARYLFKKPTIWAFDITYMLMTAIFLCGAAYTLAENRHIRIDFLYVKFSERKKVIADLIGLIVISLPVLSYVTFYAVNKFIWSIKVNESSDLTPWHPVLWPFRGFMVLGFILLNIQVVTEILKIFRTLIVKAENQGE
jgi:TRAP-type mannitol/chloroaromatic compound transport system permease small subunit